MIDKMGTTNNESSFLSAWRKAWALTARNVYGRAGLILTEQDVKDLRTKGAKLDLGREIDLLKRELGQF